MISRKYYEAEFFSYPDLVFLSEMRKMLGGITERKALDLLHAATMLAETMLLCTDALPLTDADMVGLITTATELEKKPARKPAPVEEDEDDEEDECFCCGDCTICGICDEEEDNEDEDLNPVGATGKPMGLDELMLHLSMYMEDAEEQLDDARAILKATSAKKPAAEVPTPAVQ